MSIRFFDHSFSRSIGIHAAILLLALFYVNHLPAVRPAHEPIDISFIDKKIKKETNDNQDNHRAVVQKSLGQEVKIAKKDSFLSDKTREVNEQFSAKNAGEAARRSPVRPVQKVVEQQPKPAKEVRLSDLGMKIAPTTKKDYKEQRNWANAQTGEELRGGQYIQGMKEGEVSALNTKEFVFFSYFDRVRKQLDQAWQPILRENIEHIFRSGRHLASHADYITRTVVTLSGRGEIMKVQLIEESGTHDLDQAAVDALNKAGPYPNPPKGLVDTTGAIQIRWDFILKT